MPDFVFAYRNQVGYAPTPETRDAWTAWFDGMGEQLADLGKPAVARATLGNCSTDHTELGGYSLIRADDLDAAMAIAKGCPHLERGGGIEVGQLGDVPAPAA
jgi:YCII-related domain